MPTAPSAPKYLGRLEWRSIGPFRGGRVVAVAGDPLDRQVFYFGSTGGGVWKTTDGGLFWENVSDGFFARASVGSLAVAPSDPNVVYAAMGEACIRGNVSHGDGVYRSTDAGKTWTHLGLTATRNIGRVRVDPGNPDTAFVAALGHAHGPNRDRGLYRTRDGGRTWKKVLYRGEKAGAIDVSIDPRNPRVVYATFWEAERNAWRLTSGGPGGGIFRSRDGGDTWTELSRAKGLPGGLLGKIGIVASPARAGRVWAIVEAQDGGVFRSDDGGDTWERLSEERGLRQRAWYYHHIYADPRDPETVWVLNVDAWRSIDGGATFVVSTIPHGDNHDLWIDPADPKRMISGHDGGACVSFNGGESWSSIYNQPTSELYHVTTDSRSPYRIYGAQQDNTTITVPSRATIAGITNGEAYAVGGGEAGYIAVRPDDPDVVFAGNYQGMLTRYDRRSGQSRTIMVWPESTAGEGAAHVKYRFQWTYPIHLSPHDPGVLYVCGNHVFRSNDEGATWDRISPDLTRDDRSKQGASGGPITHDNTGAEYYCTIFAFAESPVAKGVLWAGSDDGLVHVSRDGGKRWTNVTPPGIPAWTLVSMIEASPHDAGTAFVAATRYRLDDFRPMLFTTTDYGKTWTAIVRGLAADDLTRCVREDPARAGLLYCGTETGARVSFDGGGRWETMGGNLPVVPIHDLVVKDGDLVVATHGRAFWILDDLSPLRQRTAALERAAVHLFAPRPAVRYKTDIGFPQPDTAMKTYRMPGATMVTTRRVDDPKTGEKVQLFIDAGKNPPDGVIVHYWLHERPAGTIALSFHDARGHEIKRFISKPDDPAVAKSERTKEKTAENTAETTKDPRVPKQAGLNRFVWNMRHPDAERFEGPGYYEGLDRLLAGPVAAPGTYRIRLHVGRETQEVACLIVKDPRVMAATQADLDAQQVLALRVRDTLSMAHRTITAAHRLREQVEALAKRAGPGRVTSAARPLARRLAGVQEALVQVKAKSRQDTLNYGAKVNAKLGGLGVAVGSADFAPTRAMHEVYAHLAKQVEVQVARLAALEKAEVPAFDRLVEAAGLTALGRKPAAKSAGRRPRRTQARSPGRPETVRQRGGDR